MRYKILKLSTVLGIFFLFILNISCLSIYIVDSSAEVLSRGTDTALNDTSLIYGTVYDEATNNMPYPGVSIWIEDSDIKTSSDTLGNFSLKVLPGTYTIKCLHPYSDVRFTAVLDDVLLMSNEKVEIQFFHGYMAE